MNLFALPSLLTSVLLLVTATVAFTRNHRGKLERVFVLFCIFSAYWAFVEYGIRQSDTYEEAYLWLKIGAFRPILVSFLLHFALLYNRRKGNRNFPFAVPLSYGLALSFSMINLFTDWIKGTPERVYWGWAFGRNGFAPVQYLFIALTMAAIATLVWISVRCYLKLRLERRFRGRPGLIAILVLSVAGLLTHSAEHIFTAQIPETTSLIAFGFAVTIFMTVIRHRLFPTPAVTADLIVNTMDEFLLVTDRDNTVAWANKSLIDKTLFTESELRGQPPEKCLDISGGLDATDYDGSQQSCSGTLVCRSGEKTPIMMSIRRLKSPDGTTIATVYLAKDISLQEKTEAQLRKSQRLESLELVVRSISHDFSNLLSAISGNLALAAIAENNNQRADYVQNAQHAVQVAGGLLKRFSAISKDHDRVPEACSVPELLESAASMTLGAAPVTVTFNFADNIPEVYVDRNQILQVLTNLFINARQAMESQGIVTVTANVCRNAAGEADRMVEIAISDTGKGIEPSAIPKIFDPFFTTRKDGSGLGLAIAKSIIDSHGGDIRVAGPPNKGATFTIQLPVAGDENDPVPFHQRDFGRISARVLIVDDDKIVAQAIGAMLGEAGCETVTINDANETLQCFEQHYSNGKAFDLVVLDLHFPLQDGAVKITDRIRAIDPEVPTLLMTGDRNSKYLNNYSEYGFRAAVTKPFTSNELKWAVEIALNGTPEVVCDSEEKAN